ncbi:UMP-CMP kinase-like [Dendronephthya gigantea]|uniref:UMP-CMP kinase-like n=1 Tax=Dendronephthya gigantea TaxID=151771 RepID=UPI00106D6E0D|nr:UMP-CMP kinase-like [Dendronephthya gigantea]XP_028402143.1 UMP-CMP kinase-like [Dendronephthya gigantea]
MSSQMPVVAFVLGGPGAGKGTQCEKIVETFGFVHLSAGELLRQERDSGSKDGNLIQDYIKEGKIVPVAITISLLQKAMKNSPVKRFLVDGFPRNEDNLQGWSERMDGIVDVKCVLFFDCPEEECIRRIVERGKTSGRTDDNIDSLRKRFKTYKEQTMPIIKYYEKLNLVKTIPAARTPDEIFEDVKEAINAILE